VLILLPLFKIRWKGRSKAGIIGYFSGIGIGYMLVELILIQSFNFYFGNQVYSASAVITSMLIFSGLGSYYSNFFVRNRRRLLMLFTFIVSLLFTFAFFLTPILQHTVHVNLILKLVIVLLITGPLAFCMGIPFPAGLSHISKTQHEVVSWAWGINGCVSVISTALATIIAVEIGFTWVILFAALGYCLSLLVQLRWK
jgi:hypothetical protein